MIHFVKHNPRIEFTHSNLRHMSRHVLCSRYLFLCISNLFVLISEGGISISSHHVCTQWQPVPEGVDGCWCGIAWPLYTEDKTYSADGDVLIILLAQDDGNWTEGRVRTALTNVTSRNLGELETSSEYAEVFSHRHLPPDSWEIRWSVATSQYSTDEEYGESLTDAHNFFADRIFYHSYPYPHNLE